MAKECLKEECINAVFGKGYCKWHQYLREDKKNIVKKVKPFKQIRRESVKTSSLKRKYLKRRVEFLDGKICPITGRPATEIHHTNGREYGLLNKEDYWLAVTREGHQRIHANPRWAREKGYLI